MFILHVWKMEEDGARSLSVIGEEAMGTRQNVGNSI